MDEILQPQDEHSLRVLFRDKVRSLIQRMGLKVYDEFDSADFDSRIFTVIGASRVANLKQLKEGLLSLNQKVIEIETLHYKGLYFESAPKLIGLIIAPKNEHVSLDQSIMNYYRDSLLIYELQNYGYENKLDGLISLDLATSMSLSRGDELVTAEILGTSFNQLNYKKYENTHKEYIKHYLEFKTNQLTFKYEPNQYNNSIAVFSRLYYWEIRVMADILKGQNIIVHDVGTSVAQFPLLLSALSPEELFGLNIEKILASDNGWTGEHLIRLLTRKNSGYKPIQFIKIDLTTEIDAVPMVDVTIINDVLEHLPDDRSALIALNELWRKTKKLLIAHVPIESEPNPAWGHNISFSGEKIRKWASELSGGCFLGDLYMEDNQSLSDLGYLIVAK